MMSKRRRLFVLLSMDCGGLTPPGNSAQDEGEGGVQPPQSKPLGAAIRTTAAACLAIMSVCACTGKRAVNPAESPAKVEANRQPLTLKEISRLDQKMFEHSLRPLRQGLEQADPAAADQETVRAIFGKLRETDDSAQDYWPTLLRFLHFESARTAPNAPPPGQQARSLTDILSVGIMRGIHPKGKTILFDGGSFGNSDFTECRIIFTQTPVEMHHVDFKDCAFDFPTTDTPSLYLRKLSWMLLSSDLRSVSIPNL
jgi:hypothetical protein